MLVNVCKVVIYLEHGSGKFFHDSTENWRYFTWINSGRRDLNSDGCFSTASTAGVRRIARIVARKLSSRYKKRLPPPPPSAGKDSDQQSHPGTLA